MRLLCLLLSSAWQLSVAQMLDPSIDDEAGPFSYFRFPVDVIGIMDGREGTMVTPEGYLCTGYGELMFFIGRPEVPVQQRVKTLLDGHLPVVQYEFSRDDVRYRFSAYAATLDGNPQSPMAAFVRWVVTNTSPEPRTTHLTVATRYQNEANTDWGIGDNRFNRPAQPRRIGGYEQEGTSFNPEWEYSFGDDHFMRDGKVMYLFQEELSPERRIVLKTGYNEEPEFGPMRIPILPTTPVGVARYELSLKPGESRSIDLKMPYRPADPTGEFVGSLRAASYDTYLARTRELWNALFDGGIGMSVPEEKVNDTFKASLVYDCIARDRIGPWYVQKVNEFQYDAFWLRDASYIVRMYDISGYHDIARQCLEFFGEWQTDDGNFLSQGGQYDGWGQALWAYGQHVRLTNDAEFARSILPKVTRALDWLRRARAGDPLGLVPETTPGDNENITGHITGHNFWALIGLAHAARLAETAGEDHLAAVLKSEYRSLRDTLLHRLIEVTEATGGYIPPGLDGHGGYDWGNLMTVYPERILPADHPMVTRTLNVTREKYREGIMTYADQRYLHHYLTIKNTETEVIRGDQKMALEEMYALLVHTSSTHAGFEFSIRPWGDRDFGMNLSPHGWFAATFRTLMRNMLLREEGDDLHLMSVVSPAWMKPGDSIVVRHAPTDFGEVSMTLISGDREARMDFQPSFVRAPADIVLHVPWFLEGVSAFADGKECRVVGNGVSIPPDAGSVVLRWNAMIPQPALSYQASVEGFRKESRRRYQIYLRGGAHDAKE